MPGLPVHSGRVGQYWGNAYRKRLHGHQAPRSRSRRGGGYDNALPGTTPAESLWSGLPAEVLEVRERPVFADLADAQRSVADHSDYSHHGCLHSRIGYQAPTTRINSPFSFVP